MKITTASVTIEDKINGDELIRKIETAGRTCYKSEDKIAKGTAEAFIKRIISSGHESVIEHEKVTVRFVCDRGVSHELVRHRIASFSQESTRYCNYANNRFGNEITVIEPCYWENNDKMKALWLQAMADAERHYFELIENGANAQEARSVLPNSLKTEIVVTMNLREWRHFFKLRTVKNAHPQMREIAVEALVMFKEAILMVFDDIPIPEEAKGDSVLRGVIVI
uniref:FAD-dependent thymidylate synthase n=1 Tax=Candidatus Kentrum sp. TUN TaxID=2126343 RepID=A0A450ZBJ9_9GAMM|nr:MAG: thymidylate synthase (FAD) [Candidatus Kentron sp. TUN]VFK51149.1 MAG: thymidylate synthase (FAD) [Candidatus Kentron sp. TUN]VFK57336.1 MAG: thymidylate synthase (FAD) [Candidatus Kentron sp. TUN]